MTYVGLKNFEIRFTVEVRETLPKDVEEWTKKEILVSVWAHSEDDAIAALAKKLEIGIDD